MDFSGDILGFFGDSLGLLWQFSLGIPQAWEFYWNSIGIFFGNSLKIISEVFGNFLDILSEFSGNSLIFGYERN